MCLITTQTINSFPAPEFQPCLTATKSNTRTGKETMIKRFIIGKPIETETVISKPEITDGEIPFFKDGHICISLSDKDIVYGLGENVRGINKRGFRYVSFCSDDPQHNEEKASLYGAHNFIVVCSPEEASTSLGIFVDSPGKVTFDIGFTNLNRIDIETESGSFELYLISENSPLETIKSFRRLIGRSYIPPKWAFGYGQSRWGYASSADLREVVEGYRKASLPLDMIYADIDYMDHYKDFTVNRTGYPDFEELVTELKNKHVRIIPIIDAGVKIEKGYEVYEEGVANNYFCKDENNEDFVVGVWPGNCHFPDMLNEEARRWFGQKYKFLLDMGIEGFWNDMNEPAVFYSEKHLSEVFHDIENYKGMNLDIQSFFAFKDLVNGINNSPADYRSFYHNYRGEKVRHDLVHNLYGFNMTKGAAEAFSELVPNRRILLFSRASCIGMHRYGGIWTGDNASFWSHLLMNFKMMPSLNMCGFLYAGADMGGFGSNVSEDLLLRWTAVSLFTPLMRNHAARGTRNQEMYRFPDSAEGFRNLLGARYRLVPYLYSEFMKAVRDDGMMFSPLGFEYSDSISRETEDQLLIGNEIMIAPVFEQNTSGRVVYFPEEMKEIRFENMEVSEGPIYKKGYHYVDIPLGVTDIFIRPGKSIPIGPAVFGIDEVDSSQITMYRFEGTSGQKVMEYELYDDDGISIPQWD